MAISFLLIHVVVRFYLYMNGGARYTLKTFSLLKMQLRKRERERKRDRENRVKDTEIEKAGQERVSMKRGVRLRLGN